MSCVPVKCNRCDKMFQEPLEDYENYMQFHFRWFCKKCREEIRDIKLKKHR